ncbi:MAG: hypothetical protein HY908_07200, partial [Myxococcales bacterium]|nr:hypothetical protein [Myxococcales bacterium]
PTTAPAASGNGPEPSAPDTGAAPASAAPGASEAPPGPDYGAARVRQVAVPGSDTNMGVATVGIRAPLAKVRRIIQDYGKYDQVLPKLEQSRVVGRTKEGATDVYVRAPILHGMMHVWAKLRFDKPKPFQESGEVIASELVEGNIGSWHARWKLWPCGPERTLLTMELHVEVDAPVPDSLVGDMLAWAAEHSVDAVREQAECPPKP